MGPAQVQFKPGDGDPRIGADPLSVVERAADVRRVESEQIHECFLSVWHHWFEAECGWICKEPCSAESLALGCHSPTEGERFAELFAKSVDVVLAGVVHGLADDKHNVCFGADR